MDNTTNTLAGFEASYSAYLDDYNKQGDKFLKAETAGQKNAALDDLSYIRDGDRLLGKKMLELALDRTENKNLRLKAISKLGNYAAGDTVAIGRLIRLMTAIKEYIELRRAALDLLLGISFSSVALNARMPQFREGLRRLLADKDPELVQKAIKKLAAYNDAMAEQLLAGGLEDHSKALISDAGAIQLLGGYQTNNHNVLIRSFLERSKDPAVQVEAIRALSADEGSHGLIQGYLDNKQADKHVRLMSLSALNAAVPEKFLASAQAIISDENDYSDVKIAALNTIALEPKYHELVLKDKGFNASVSSLLNNDNQALRLESANYLQISEKQGNTEG